MVHFVGQFPISNMIRSLKCVEKADCPANFRENHHRPAPNDIVTFCRRRPDSPGTSHKMGIALLYEKHSHAGWIREYDIKRFNTRRSLERTLNHHIYGRIVSISEEIRWEEGGGICSKGVVSMEVVREEDIETTDGESSPVEEAREYIQQGNQ